ncbi:MAG TPA: branched-chain amino acid ABC transporter permease [Alphaproteobacteria bacterium]|nr:branched-chain amino acid ABC transporter permease [Alphaproteobacteria bacterium]
MSNPRIRATLAVAVILLVVLVAVPGVLDVLGRSYLYQLVNLALIFALLASSLHLVTGVAGLLHLGHAAFYGVGAYAAALLSTHYGIGIALTLPAAGLASALIAFVVALPTMRLVSIYFAVATLGIGQMINLVLLNWVDVTEGPNGIILFGGLELFGIDLSSPAKAYYLVAVVVVAAIYVIHRLSHSYYGNALRSVREDDQCADAMGVNTVRLKVEAFTLSAFFAGIAGALWAHTTGYISPPNFDFLTSIQVLAMVVVGGLGSLPGAIVGALLLTLLPELLRDVGDFRNMLVGVAMFLSILFLPKGLLGEVSALDMVRRNFATAWKRERTGKGIGWA